MSASIDRTVTAINNARSRLGAQSALLLPPLSFYPLRFCTPTTISTYSIYWNLFEENRTRIGGDIWVASLDAENPPVPQTPTVAWKLWLLLQIQPENSTKLEIPTHTLYYIYREQQSAIQAWGVQSIEPFLPLPWRTPNSTVSQCRRLNL